MYVDSSIIKIGNKSYPRHLIHTKEKKRFYLMMKDNNNLKKAKYYLNAKK